MADHAHCHCIPVGYSEETTGVRDAAGNKVVSRDRQANDLMCCFCGQFRDGKLKFVQDEGHGPLRHRTQYVDKKRD